MCDCFLGLYWRQLFKTFIRDGSFFTEQRARVLNSASARLNGATDWQASFSDWLPEFAFELLLIVNIHAGSPCYLLQFFILRTDQNICILELINVPGYSFLVLAVGLDHLSEVVDFCLEFLNAFLVELNFLIIIELRLLPHRIRRFAENIGLFRILLGWAEPLGESFDKFIDRGLLPLQFLACLPPFLAGFFLRCFKEVICIEWQTFLLKQLKLNIEVLLVVVVVVQDVGCNNRRVAVRGHALVLSLEFSNPLLDG